MSSVNIRRAVENIRANTTVYTAIAETVVNAIQAIETARRTDGKIAIRVHRDDQIEMDDSLPEIHSFEIQDNGIGFTEEHRQSFDTLYTDLKLSAGGKGFGRFICLKYFENLDIESIFRENDRHKQRKFSMGKANDIIVNERVSESAEQQSGTVVHLRVLKKPKSIDKRLSTIARNLVENLLPYFITKDYDCPEIVISENDGSDSIRLNDYFSNELSAVIKEIPVKSNTFTLKAIQDDEEFLVRVFKLYFPKNQTSRISLVAHKERSPVHHSISTSQSSARIFMNGRALGT